MPDDASTSPVTVLLAFVGVLLINAGAVYLIVFAVHNLATFGIASVAVTAAAIFTDIVTIRTLVRRRRSPS